MENINLSEHFYSIQGEGNFIGTPAYFIRFSKCNLACGKNKNSKWVCDTAEQMKNDKSVPVKEIFENFDKLGIFNSEDKVTHLVITGGEPLLKSNREIFLDFLEEYRKYYNRNFSNMIEFETNGTQRPFEIEGILNNVNHFYNVSLKLSSSGNNLNLRLKPEVLKMFINLSKYKKNVNFKFVVADEEDLKEILDLKQKFNIDSETISLMPAMTLRDEFFEKTKGIIDIAMKEKLRVSPRLQIAIWDNSWGK